MNKKRLSLWNILLAFLLEQRLPYRLGIKLYPKLNNLYRFFFFKELEKTKPIEITNDTKKAEVHSLICHQDILMYIAAIKSLWHNLRGIERKIGIVVYDGGLINSDYKLLEKHVRGIRIIKKNNYENIIKSELKNYPSCLRAYSECALIAKLFLPYLTAGTEKIILIDADIFFYAEPAELVSWIENDEKINYYLFIATKYPFGGIVIKNAEEKVVQHLNSGLLFCNKGLFKFDLLERFFNKEEFITTSDNQWGCSEQAAYAHLFRHGEQCQLDKEKYNCASDPCVLMQEREKDYIFRHFAMLGKQAFFLINLKYLKILNGDKPKARV